MSSSPLMKLFMAALIPWVFKRICSGVFTLMVLRNLLLSAKRNRPFLQRSRRDPRLSPVLGKPQISALVLLQLHYDISQSQALVLAPTSELAQHIEKVMRALGDYQGVKVHACVGGTSAREDQHILQAGVHVSVVTPGRVFDMLKRQSFPADNIKMFVLDEADEMLYLGFKDEDYSDLSHIPASPTKDSSGCFLSNNATGSS